MSRTSRQKQKLLCVQKILLEKTDENHGLTAEGIISELSHYGFSCDRKSIYDDIHALEDAGYDIAHDRKGFRVVSRDFELPELKLLVDAVSSSKFITHKKSNNLIKKIEKLLSVHDAKLLSREVYVANRVKTFNEKIYIIVDNISTAISQKRQISFSYYEWVLNFAYPDKIKKALKKGGKKYIVSPLFLLWDYENYYLVAIDEETKIRKHYRVDKINNIEILEKESIETDKNEKVFDPALYSKSVFGMFGGERTEVTLKVKNSFIGVIVDRFGTDLNISPCNESYFYVKIKVVISPQFFGWLCGLGNNAKICSPASVETEFKLFLENMIKLY